MSSANLFVQFNTQPRLIGHLQIAVSKHFAAFCLNDVIPVAQFNAVGFERDERLDRRAGVTVRDCADRSAHVVASHCDVVEVRPIGDLLGLEQSSHFLWVRLDDVARLLLDKVPKGVAAVKVLPVAVGAGEERVNRAIASAFCGGIGSSMNHRFKSSVILAKRIESPML